MSSPEIRIKRADLLMENASAYLHELWCPDEDMPTDAVVVDKVEQFQAAWKPYNGEVQRALQKLTGLSFRKNIIDVYIAPHFWAFSDPLVIGWHYTPSRFPEILTHELAHIILTDNNQVAYDSPLLDRWNTLFGMQSDTDTLVHIPVHALLQGVFDDELHEPERTQNDIAACPVNSPYTYAWEYVQRVGYQSVIQLLAADYKQLAILQK